MQQGDSSAEKSLKDAVLEVLQRTPNLRAAEIADVLGRSRNEVNDCLNGELNGLVRQGKDYRWQIVQRTATPPRASLGARSELQRLSRYYLECISLDMEQGCSVFAQNRQGELKYTELPSVPIGTDTEWWNHKGIGTLLDQLRAEPARITLWLGYPVRVRHHRSPQWEGRFVEPLIVWPVVFPEIPEERPYIDEQLPLLNAKALRGLAMGDPSHIAEENAQLSDELGLVNPSDPPPELDELVARLARLRPDWDWQEPLLPSACTAKPPLGRITVSGIYNRAVMIAGERSPYTVGLESELQSLGKMEINQVRPTALGAWLAADTSQDLKPDALPLIEVVPMNMEQRAAVRSALTARHTVVTGPPGTGKSQVVTNIVVNAAWRGMKVLLASKNNKAVDVVEARVNGLGSRPVLLRLGSREHLSRLAEYLSQMLSGTPSEDLEACYQEGLARHHSLGRMLSELDRLQQRTLELRNIVDGLDFQSEVARASFGDRFPSLTAEDREKASRLLPEFERAINNADRSRQSLIGQTFWELLRRGRLASLENTLTDAVETFERLSIKLPEFNADPDLATLRECLEELKFRLRLVDGVLEYKGALQALQQSDSFEEIDRKRAKLLHEIGKNSRQLWRDWVQLVPTRLSQAERSDIAEYAAAVQLLTGNDADRVHTSAKLQARRLQDRITGIFTCWAVTSLSARGRLPLEPNFFDLVVIDEASQCDIASVLPLLLRARRSVVIGDPMQLRHISALSRHRDSELQHKHGLVESRMAWMYSVSSAFDVAQSVAQPGNIICLRDHHRSHGDIIGFSNQEFYRGQLRVATRYPSLKRPNSVGPAIHWQNVQGPVSHSTEGGASNLAEARALVDALIDLLVRQSYHGTVGVVTPFRAQASLLQRLITDCAPLQHVAARTNLLVDTVHKFQGDERDVVFFSLVVSESTPQGALSFLRNNGNLFNVAVTRARGLLHVIGNRKVAASSGVPYLQTFVSYVERLEKSRETTLPVYPAIVGEEFPAVAHPERVSDWERMLFRAMVASGLRPIPQFSVEQYDLDFALFCGSRKLAIEVDGEQYHRTWTGELCLRDQLRNQRLMELGWDVQRFWVYEVRDQLTDCVARLKEWCSRETLPENPV